MPNAIESYWYAEDCIIKRSLYWISGRGRENKKKYAKTLRIMIWIMRDPCGKVHTTHSANVSRWQAKLHEYLLECMSACEPQNVFAIINMDRICQPMRMTRVIYIGMTPNRAGSPTNQYENHLVIINDNSFVCVFNNVILLQTPWLIVIIFIVSDVAVVALYTNRCISTFHLCTQIYSFHARVVYDCILVFVRGKPERFLSHIEMAGVL